MKKACNLRGYLSWDARPQVLGKVFLQRSPRIANILVSRKSSTNRFSGHNSILTGWQTGNSIPHIGIGMPPQRYMYKWWNMQQGWAKLPFLFALREPFCRALIYNTRTSRVQNRITTGAKSCNIKATLLGFDSTLYEQVHMLFISLTCPIPGSVISLFFSRLLLSSHGYCEVGWIRDSASIWISRTITANPSIYSRRRQNVRLLIRLILRVTDYRCA